MIRILHVISGLDPGGAETMLYRLVCAMDRRRFATAVISLTDIGSIGRRLRASDVDVQAVGLSPTVSGLLGLDRLVRRVRAFEPDVIQTWMYHADLFGGVAGRVATRAAIVWGIHRADLGPAMLGHKTRAIARVCARISSRIPRRIVCCSRAARESHVSFGYDDRPMVVIPNGIDVELFRPDSARRAEIRDELGLGSEIVVGHFARWHPSKDHRTFLQAAGAAARELDVRFLLCGPGITDRNDILQDEIQQAGLLDRARLLGQREDMHRLMAAIDVLVSSSRTEAFSIITAEAMASAIPCLVTDVGFCRDLVGGTGWVVPPDDPEALGRALIDLLRMDPSHRAEMGRRARERIRSCFAIESIARRYESLYEDLALHPESAV